MDASSLITQLLYTRLEIFEVRVLEWVGGTIFLRAVHQLQQRSAIQDLYLSRKETAHKEPHARSQPSRGKSVEGSDRRNLDGVLSGHCAAFALG